MLDTMLPLLAPLSVNLVLVFAALHLTVFAHEAAHLLAAKAVRVKALSLRSGIGRSVSMTARSGFVWTFGINPMRGNIYVDDSVTPWRNIVVYLAGPVLNVTFAVIGISLWVHLGHSIPVMCFAVINSFAAVENMIPVANRDGAQILREVKRGRAQRSSQKDALNTVR